MFAISVAQLLKESIGSVREYEIEGMLGITKKECRVAGEIRLTRTDRGILVNARLNSEVELTCGRCLSEYDWSFDLHFKEEYLQTVDLVSGARLSLPEESSDFTIDQRHILDISEAVRQFALLSMPIKAVCCEDCAGLCSRCGHNLNLGPCRCPAEEVDHRWAPLLKLNNEREGNR